MATSALEPHYARSFKDKDSTVSRVLTLNANQIHHSLIEDVDITCFICLQSPKNLSTLNF